MLELWQGPVDHWIGCGSPGRRSGSGSAATRRIPALRSSHPLSSPPAITPSQWEPARRSDLRRPPLPIKPTVGAPGRRRARLQITGVRRCWPCHTRNEITPISPPAEVHRHGSADAQRCQRDPCCDEHIRRESEPIGASEALRPKQFGGLPLDHALGGHAAPLSTFHRKKRGPLILGRSPAPSPGIVARIVDCQGQRRGAATLVAIRVCGHGFPPHRSAPRTAIAEVLDNPGHRPPPIGVGPGIGERTAASNRLAKNTAPARRRPGTECRMHHPNSRAIAVGTGLASGGRLGRRISTESIRPGLDRSIEQNRKQAHCGLLRTWALREKFASDTGTCSLLASAGYASAPTSNERPLVW